MLLKTSAGKDRVQWFWGTVLRAATEHDMKYASDDDKEYAENGLILYVVDYDKENELESVALEANFNNGDIEIV